MPLVNSASKDAVEQNTKTEVEAGKKPDQAYAIANAIARRVKAKEEEFEQAKEPTNVTGTN